MLFLIAHKVRGEPAFDIALRCDDMGTESDPGPWWIIPTSGHRAYPYWSIPFEDLAEAVGMGECEALNVPPCPEDWPDHYTVREEVVKKLGGLAERLGLRTKPKTVWRRPV